MDFAPILHQLSNLPPQPPEVSVAVNLMIRVINTVVAYGVAFVGFLHGLLKVAKQSNTPSSVVTMIFHRIREQQVDNLSEQLRIIESSTSVAIGLNASLVVSDLLATVTSRNSEATNLLADMRFLMKSNSSLAWLGRDIMIDELAGNDVFEAQCTSGEAVIVKVYEGHGKNQSPERAQKADWLTRTLKYYPMETIEGIYRMELIDFQVQRGIRCALPPFSSSLVHLDPEIGYSQIDISTNKTSKADKNPSKPQPGIDIVCGFFAGSLFWMSDTTTSIEEIVDNDRHMSIEQVGISLFAYQWLGPCRALVQSDVPIALGNIGYMPKSSSGEAWNNLPPAEPEVVAFEGQPVYKKYTYIDPPVTSAMNWMNCYVWISPRDIWKFYSRYVMQFINDHNLSISPYDLQLVTLANVECSFALYLDDERCQTAS
ncbi:hypothetical protein BU17DRAFT_70710 [Hysterangium stoloniferum]|nr:hypothetical protein BU17DRAFT_70710 [Hysterangium stoloniferum]